MTKCTVCNDTGEAGRLCFLDCVAPGCTAAIERTALNDDMRKAGPLTKEDRDWFVHQRAIAQERATAWNALRQIQAMYASGNFDAHVMLAEEIKRIEP